MFDYSIVIRTLGNTGDKYLQMLRAIERQTVKPREVVVVIPDGYTLDHRLGNERIVRSPKGMVTQRAVGIAEAAGDYMLVLDDDLDFPDDFAEQLYSDMQKEHLDCVLAFPTWGAPEGSAATRHSIKARTKMFVRRLRGAFTGQVFYSRRKSEWFDVITSAAGHRTYVNCEDKPCQAGCFQCFFISSAKAKAVRFDEEAWLEQGSLSQYAAYDDAVFFYKMYKQGGRIAYSQTTQYAHLDAGAGRKSSSRLHAKQIRLYSIARNRTIFWHKHIWSGQRTLHTLLGGIYGLGNYALYSTLANIHPKNWPAISALWRGYRDAFRFIRQEK